MMFCSLYCGWLGLFHLVPDFSLSSVFISVFLVSLGNVDDTLCVCRKALQTPNMDLIETEHINA